MLRNLRFPKGYSLRVLHILGVLQVLGVFPRCKPLKTLYTRRRIVVKSLVKKFLTGYFPGFLKQQILANQAGFRSKKLSCGLPLNAGVV